MKRTSQGLQAPLPLKAIRTMGNACATIANNKLSDFRYFVFV